MLYGELIRLDIFSHNSYMCTLISRGDLEPASASQIGCETTPDCSMRMDCRSQEFVSETVIEVCHFIKTFVILMALAWSVGRSVDRSVSK